MEEGRNKLQFGKFEKLLGEKSNATSRNMTSDGLEHKRVALADSMSPIRVNSGNGSFVGKIQDKWIIKDEKLSPQQVHQSVKMVHPGEQAIYSEADQSLTSAFAELSFSDKAATGCSASPLPNWYMSSNQSHGSVKNHISDVGSQGMGFTPFRPNTSAFYNVDDFKVIPEDLNWLKLAQKFQNVQVGYPQLMKNSSASGPPVHGVQGFQFLSNAPIGGVDFPMMSDQQHFIVDGQSLNPYLHPLQLNEAQAKWRNTEEEQRCRVQQHHLNLKHQLYQQFESQVATPSKESAATMMLSQNLRHPYFQLPISSQFNQFDQELSWNDRTIGVLNLPNHVMSANDLNSMKLFQRGGNQSFPEKILTRSHGLSTLKSVNSGHVEGSCNPVIQNGNSLSDRHFHHGPYIPRGRCLDSLRPCCSYSGTRDLSYKEVWPLSNYDSMEETKGSIYLMAKDQHGCRLLQRKFAEGNPREVDMIFFEIIDHVVELMTDPFGNYLIQKLLEVCNDDQQMQILHAITRKPGELVRISCDMHGTRAVQKVIDTLKTPEQISMVVTALKHGVVTLIKSMNGNHVAQRCLQNLLPEYSKFLFEAAAANCVELATDRHGCCVLQKCLDHSDSQQRCHIVCEIASNALILSQDPFGNYVVQCVFDLGLPGAVADILNQLEGNLADLSMQKYSSNVVEKCLKYGGDDYRTCIVQELINDPRWDQILQDPYGNYVIQAAINESKGALYAALVEAIKPHVPVLRTSPYGKKVLCCDGLKK